MARSKIEPRSNRPACERTMGLNDFLAQSRYVIKSVALRFSTYVVSRIFMGLRKDDVRMRKERYISDAGYASEDERKLGNSLSRYDRSAGVCEREMKNVKETTCRRTLFLLPWYCNVVTTMEWRRRTAKSIKGHGGYNVATTGYMVVAANRADSDSSW